MPDALPVIDPSQEIVSAYTIPREDIVEKARNFRVLLAPSECRQENPDEIVVCAPTSLRDQRLVYSGALPKPVIDEFGDALSFKVGPVELGSMKNADGTRSFGARVRF